MALESIKNSIQENDIYLLYIKSQTCNVCTELLPKVEEVANDMKVKLSVFYIEENRELGGEYHIFSAPTIIMFVMGKEVYRAGRFLQVAELEATITKYQNLLL